MQDLNKIWSSCVETLEKNKIVDDKIILDSLFKPATLEEIEDNQVIITTELKWNIDAILEKRAEIESILSNSFSKPIKIKVLEVEEYKKSLWVGAADVDTTLAEMTKRLKAAGMDDLIQGKQEQLDAWMSSK